MRPTAARRPARTILQAFESVRLPAMVFCRFLVVNQAAALFVFVQAFESLRLLADQVALDEATSSCTTDGVHVEVRIDAHNNHSPPGQPAVGEAVVPWHRSIGKYEATCCAAAGASLMS